METVTGRVNSVHNGIASVMVEAPIACRRCASGRGCGAGLLTGSEGSRHIEVKISPGMNLVAGDAVRLAVSPQQLLRAALLAYGLPLAALVSAAAVASMFVGTIGDLGAVGFAAAGLAGGVFASRRYLERESVCHQFVPVVEIPAGGEHA